MVVCWAPKVSLMQMSQLLAPACACAEFTRVAIGPFDVPIGLTPIMVGVVAAAVLPGVVLGAVRRARFAAAVRAAPSKTPAESRAASESGELADRSR